MKEQELLGVDVWSERVEDRDLDVCLGHLRGQVQGRVVLDPPDPLPEAIATEYATLTFGKVRISRIAASHPGTQEPGIMTRFDVLVEKSTS